MTMACKAIEPRTATMSFVFVNNPICQIVCRGERMAKTRNSSKKTIVVKATVRARMESAPASSASLKAPSVPIVRIAAATRMRERMSRERTPSLGLRGLRSMMSVGYGSTPSASAGRPSVTRLIQSSCTGTKNGLQRIGAGGVHHAREAEERESLLELFLTQGRELLGELAVREAEHAEGARGHLLVLEQILLAIVVGERSALSVDQMLRAGREDPFRGALDVQRDPDAVEPAVPFAFGDAEHLPKVGLRQRGMKSRHLLSLGGEGDLRDAGALGSRRLGIEARAKGRHQERAFRRVAFDDPAILVPFQGGVVAEDRALEEPSESGLIVHPDGCAPGPYFSPRIESFAADLVFA